LFPKWQCVIEVNFDFGWCGGGLTLDWVNLRDFSSNFNTNWNAASSLVVKGRCALPGGGCGAVIDSRTAMFNQGKFWEVCA
jgi:hypothetical protein